MRLFAISALVCIAAWMTAADQPEPATIIRADNGATIPAQVISENLDQVVYLLGEGAAAAETSMPRNRIRRIEYGPVSDLDFSRAIGEKSAGNPERAAERFLQAAAATPYQRVRELAYVEAAQALFDAKKPDEALKVVADLQAKAPRSVQLPSALRLKARIHLSRQDGAAAEAAAVELAKLAPIPATVLRAEILRGQGKAQEAADLLRTVWGSELTARTDVAEGEPTYAEIGMLLAGDLEKAGDVAGLRQIYDQLAFSPIAKAEQARAHRLLAESLAKEGDRAAQIKAFDHALMAAGLSRNERPAARRLCLRILAEFDKDATMKDEVAEYRTYVNTL